MKAIINVGILLITFIVSFIFFEKQGKESYTFYGDALGYYSYLPSTFIYNNFKAIEWLPKNKQIEQPILDHIERYKKECKRGPKGYYINQYTYGVALTELPFFFIAHTYEKLKGLPANGYSINYHYLIKFASLFYTFWGLFFLYISLISRFNSSISIFTTCITFIGTNLFWFTLFQSGMSHIPLFFLYSLLIYITIKVHNKPSIYLFIFLGTICGFITITRPSDIVCVFIPLLFNIYDKQSFLNKLKFLNDNKLNLLIGIGCFFIPIIPQLIFWKVFAGQFLYNSYVDQSFDWRHPHILEGLFGFSNGWLSYTPLMIVSLIGLLFYRKIKPYVFIILITLPVYIYVIYSWYCYNYINGFGSRPMIHMYPLLAFPLASIINSFIQKNYLVKVISILSIFLFVSINISYSFQVARGDIGSDNSNFRFNLNTLFKQK